MDDIKNYNPAEAETLDSREVAEMVGKQHKHLLRDINGYIENMKQGTEPKVGLSAAELKIEPSEFFIPSTYTDSTGRELPCFLVTKKGCEFIANKLTGEKGTKVHCPVCNPLQYHGGAREGRYRRKDRKER